MSPVSDYDADSWTDGYNKGVEEGEIHARRGYIKKSEVLELCGNREFCAAGGSVPECPFSSGQGCKVAALKGGETG